MKQRRISYYEGLENSLATDIEIATNLILMPLPDPKVEISVEELEKELLGLNALHHICARMRARGKGFEEISDYLKRSYGYTVSSAQVSYMVQKVLNLNYRMTPKSTELLRQQVDEQLDQIIAGVYATAAEEGRDYLKLNEGKAMLNVIDRKIKLHGLDAPIEIKHSVADEIKVLQENIYKRLEGMGGRTVIEVTQGIEGIEDEGNSCM